MTMSRWAGRCRLSIVNSLLLVAAGGMAWQADAGGNAAVPVRKVAIGFAGPLTERTAQSAREGAELAVAEANQRQLKLTHGAERLQFEMLTQDDKGDPNSAGFAAQYFIRSEVVGVIGHWSTGAALEQCPHWQAFQKRYAGMFGKPPISFSRYAYNATTILIDAVRQADSLDTAKITAALHRGKYRGLSGEIAFDKDGNALHFFYTLYQYGTPAWQAIKGFAWHREAGC